MVDISVIIPAYNVEKYLKQALDSIANQTFKNFEAICVDDCSTDSTLSILNDYANIDNRFKVLQHAQNQGQSAARNHALDIAQGEYIVFIDPDDWVDLTLFETVYNTFRTQKTESVWFNNYIYQEKENSTNIQFNENHILNCDGYYNITPENLLDFTDYVWNKAFKKSFLQEHNLRFPEGLIFEDGEFYFKCFTTTKQIYYINKPLYYYRIREGSTVTKSQKGDLNINDVFDIYMNIYNYVIENNLFNDYKNTLLKLFGIHMKTVLIPSQRENVIRLADKVLKKINFPKAFK